MPANAATTTACEVFERCISTVAVPEACSKVPVIL